MKTKAAMSSISLAFVPVTTNVTFSNSSVSYIIGGIVALLIMGYLIYTLLRPEKF